MTTSAERKRELKRAYMERVKPAGVFCIRNTVTGKVLLGSSLNLDGALNRHRFMLSQASHYNQALQRDWTLHGGGAFVFEILERVEISQEPNFDVEEGLTRLEQKWLEKLEPSGAESYNSDTHIRDV